MVGDFKQIGCDFHYIYSQTMGEIMLAVMYNTDSSMDLAPEWYREASPRTIPISRGTVFPDQMVIHECERRKSEINEKPQQRWI